MRWESYGELAVMERSWCDGELGVIENYCRIGVMEIY